MWPIQNYLNLLASFNPIVHFNINDTIYGLAIILAAHVCFWFWYSQQELDQGLRGQISNA